MYIGNGTDSVWGVTMVLATVITFSYVLALYHVENTYVPRDSVRERHSRNAPAGSEATAPESSDPAYLLDVEFNARTDDRFEFLDTSGLESVLLTELRRRTGRNVELAVSDHPAPLGRINVLVKIWEQHRVGEGSHDSLMRARLPKHIAIDLDMTTIIGDRSLDGEHELEVEFSAPLHRGLRSVDQVKRANLEEMVRQLMDQLPGQGKVLPAK